MARVGLWSFSIGPINSGPTIRSSVREGDLLREAIEEFQIGPLAQASDDPMAGSRAREVDRPARPGELSFAP